MATSANHLIEVHDLVKKFGANIVALDKVNLTIDKGEVVVIVGPSGSGKSTLLRSLNLLEIPTSGSVIFEGVDITGKKVDLNKHRQKMGMVFQHFNLFPHKTVLEEHHPGARSRSEVAWSQAEAEELAMQACWHGWAWPTGPTPIPGPALRRAESSVSPLSGPCAMQPDVMLFDEPTSALDPEMVGRSACR